DGFKFRVIRKSPGTSSPATESRFLLHLPSSLESLSWNAVTSELLGRNDVSVKNSRSRFPSTRTDRYNCGLPTDTQLPRSRQSYRRKHALIKERRFRSSQPTYHQSYFLDSEGNLSEDNGASAVCYSNPGIEEPQSGISAGDFDYLKVIGTGSFGKVFLATHRENGRYYAVKVLQKDIIVKRKEERNVMCEHSVLLKALNHPFLVTLHFSFQTKDRLYLVLDYACGGELFYHLQREGVFGESRAKFYAAEVACALGYLHSLKIVYRDLKPENILLDSAGHVLLTDFGLCKEGMSGRVTTRTFCGTPEYLAPEVLLQKEYNRTVDWWGLGAVLHEMLYGLPPFYNADRLEMLRNIIYQPLVLKPGVSSAGRDLLKRLLNRDCSKRLGAKRDLVNQDPFKSTPTSRRCQVCDSLSVWLSD
ncbi:hypothetical protein DNTS_001317, partial [Danionella cerebrum]